MFSHDDDYDQCQTLKKFLRDIGIMYFPLCFSTRLF